MGGVVGGGVAGVLGADEERAVGAFGGKDGEEERRGGGLEAVEFGGDGGGVGGGVGEEVGGGLDEDVVPGVEVGGEGGVEGVEGGVAGAEGGAEVAEAGGAESEQAASYRFV